MKTFSGTVVRGNERGRILGYPTANIPLDDITISSVYAGRVKFEDKDLIAAVFADEKRKLLESYLLDFEGDLYGKVITVELHSKIRDSAAFHDDESLKVAIREDIEKVRAYFA